MNRRGFLQIPDQERGGRTPNFILLKVGEVC
jgi:hypothetical protein